MRSWGEGGFSPAEQAALHFAERLYVDHTNIDDALFDELREHYSEAQILELGWACVSYMGFGRLIHVFGLTGDDLRAATAAPAPPPPAPSP